MGPFESMRTLTWCQLLACGLFLLLSGWHYSIGYNLMACLYLSGGLVTATFLIPGNKLAKNHHLILSSFLFSIYTLCSLALLLQPQYLNSLTHLSIHLIYPLLAFALLPFRVGLLFVLVFALFTNLVLMLQLEGTLRAAFLIGFWLVILLTTLYSFTHQSWQQKLQDQLNRDPVTQLFNRQQLFADIHKELERAQRENTLLGLISFNLQPPARFDLQTTTELSQLFAPFEELYSAGERQVCALLPLSHADKLAQRVQVIQQQRAQFDISAHLCKNDVDAIAFINAGTSLSHPINTVTGAAS